MSSFTWLDYSKHERQRAMEIVDLLGADDTRNEWGLGTVRNALIGARLGRPKPTVGCPWPKRRKNKRLREIEHMLANLAPDHVAVYLDEVDIHLNAKIGLDWMNRGKQKTVETPGNNVKRNSAARWMPTPD